VAAGCDETILLNSKREIVGCAMGNLFLRIHGSWQTAPPLSGARAGVTRRWVLSQPETIAWTLPESFLSAADSAFVCNSGLGIMPVAVMGRQRLNLTPALEWAKKWRRTFLEG
jgi:branched-subunit amino acid aminotransferase/4-amino-4-deoxychorismate lyase